MRAYFKALGVAIAFALCCQAAQAGWYTARGSAPIIDDNVTAARKNAIDDALRTAALQAGADVSIEQTSANGTLLNDRLSVKAHSPVRRLMVVEEQENGRMVTVLIKALIDENLGAACFAGNIKKTILPFVFRYNNADASASAAGIEDFDSYLSDLVYNGISDSASFNVLPIERTRLKIEQAATAADYSFQRTLDSISRRYAAQYIIVGTINSLTKSEVGNNAFTKMIYEPTRTIRFNIQVFDVYTGALVMKKDYVGDAQWNFERGAVVNLLSDKFGSSDYGQRVAQLAKYAVSDIIAKLRCATPVARITQVTDDVVRINIGSNSHIKVGMKFTINHRSDYQDRHNQTYYQSNESKVLYKVVDVSPNAATLAPVDVNNQLINVMLDDLVSLYVPKEEF